LAGSGSRAEYQKTVPMQRVNRPEEVAAAVLFLLGNEASGINGVSLPVDGGWSLCHY
jgi:NAD(P)-dependent dehydrogenase (short-subunit alcohol dehydrogenase family)